MLPVVKWWCMEGQKLIDLFKERAGDMVTPFSNGDGFSILRSYDDKMLEGYKMMIKISVREGGFVIGSVGVVHNSEGPEYSVADDKDLGLTDIYFTKEEGFRLTDEVWISYKESRLLSVNNLVNLLVANHVGNVAKWARMKAGFYDFLFRLLSWIIGQDREQVRLFRRSDSVYLLEAKKRSRDSKVRDPFGGLTKLHRNSVVTYFVFLLSTLFLLKHVYVIDEYPDVSNVVTLSILIISLLIFEKLISWVEGQYFDYLEGEKNWFFKLYIRASGNVLRFRLRDLKKHSSQI